MLLIKAFMSIFERAAQRQKDNFGSGVERAVKSYEGWVRDYAEDHELNPDGEWAQAIRNELEYIFRERSIHLASHRDIPFGVAVIDTRLRLFRNDYQDEVAVARTITDTAQWLRQNDRPGLFGRPRRSMKDYQGILWKGSEMARGLDLKSALKMTLRTRK